MSLLVGKKAIIFGVANDYSIAWSIAKILKDNGAQVALSYLNDAIKKRVEPLSQELGADFIFEMDVSEDSHYERLSHIVEQKWGNVDFVIHSLAFAEREDLSRDFIKTSRKGFQTAMDVSAFSLVGISSALLPLLNPGGSVITMTYYGSQKVIPNYNVMGVAKAALEAAVRYLSVDLGKKKVKINAISAGPIKTLAASAVSGLKEKLSLAKERAPMQENITQGDVAKTALYLCSDLSHGVTGQVLYVDAGLSTMGF
ncbi:MAG: enoyl-ACP reductase [Bacteriovoracaceae bacterium]|nr:enoyl-ACP reductase [Bacteriovoracaceae bacterium]